MLTTQDLINKIAARQKERERAMPILGGDSWNFPKDKQAIMLCEILDDILQQKLQTDKVLEGILKDIQGNLASMAETKIERILKKSLN